MRKLSKSLQLFAVCLALFPCDIMAQSQVSDPGFRHIVMITFKQDAAADSIEALDDVYKDLSKSPLVRDFDWGVNVSSRESGVLIHVYNTTFASMDDLEKYRNLPQYKRLFQLSLPIASDVNVADYKIRK